MKKRSKRQPVKVPRFVATAVRQGVRLADTIGIEKADDGSWLTIKFRKLPTQTPEPRR